MRTTTQSNGLLFSWLCFFRCNAERGSDPSTPASRSAVSPDSLTSSAVSNSIGFEGKIKRVLIDSRPPEGVNLHALLENSSMDLNELKLSVSKCLPGEVIYDLT